MSASSFGDHRLGARLRLYAAMALVVAVGGLVPATDADALPGAEQRVAGAAVPRAGRLTVSVAPLLPSERTRGFFQRGEVVSLRATMKGLQGKPVLQVKAQGGWKPFKRVKTSAARDGMFFTVKPRAAKQRLRVLWSRNGRPRLTNTVRVDVSPAGSTVSLVSGVAVDQVMHVSGDGTVVVYQEVPSGLRVVDRAGRIEPIPVDGRVDVTSVSRDGRYITYMQGAGPLDNPSAYTFTTYRYDRAAQSAIAIATHRPYVSDGLKVVVRDVSGDGQFAVLERSIDGQFDALLMRNLTSGDETVVYAPTPEERAAGLTAGPVRVSTTGDTVAFDIGRGRTQSVRVWRRATGQATQVAISGGAHILGSTGGGVLLRMTGDGSTLLFDNNRSVQMLNLTTGVTTTIPVAVSVGSTHAVELSGNGTAILVVSGAATGIYQTTTGRWFAINDEPVVSSIADDGRTVPFTNGVYGNAGGVNLWTAP